MSLLALQTWRSWDRQIRSAEQEQPMKRGGETGDERERAQSLQSEAECWIAVYCGGIPEFLVRRLRRSQAHVRGWRRLMIMGACWRTECERRGTGVAITGKVMGIRALIIRIAKTKPRNNGSLPD